MELLVPIYASLLALAGCAAVTDTRTGRIPNALTLSALLLAPLAQLAGAGIGGLFSSLGGVLVCGLVPYFLFRRGAMGGGDVKLFTALGAVGGIELGMEIQLAAFIVTSTFALLQLAWQGLLWRTLWRSARLAMGLWRPHAAAAVEGPLTSMRMGLPIFIGCAATLCLRHPIWWA